MLTYFRNLIWGVLFAFGELLPGVGMQTVAIIAGLYDDMINFMYEGTEFLKAIALFIFGKVKKEEIVKAFKAINWAFGLPVFVGIALTIVALSRIVGSLFDSFPTQVAAISFGIVLASVAIPYKEITEKTWKEGLLFLASFAAFYGLFSIRAVDFNTDPSLWIFFGGGLIASLAGFFPGISISFALLLMGLYKPLLNSVDQLSSRNADLNSFITVLFFMVGLAIGMLFCVRMLALLIQKYKSLFLSFIVGLILASLRALWPFVAVGTDELVLPWQVPLPQFTQQLIFITIAFVLVSLVRKLAENKGTLASSFGPKERTVLSN